MFVRTKTATTELAEELEARGVQTIMEAINSSTVVMIGGNFYYILNNIETVCLAGFLTNCCVESTMRSAYEKGFNVVTLTDCTAATSAAGQKAATDGTFGMFSTPMAAEELKAKLANAPAADKARRLHVRLLRLRAGGPVRAAPGARAAAF